MPLRALYGAVLLLLCGCEQRVARAETADQATAIANAYLAENVIRVPANRLKIETIDMGDRWRLSYSYPDGGTGGPVIVVVNKQSGKVVHMETQQ